MKRGLAPWEITALDSKVHDRAAFSCGAPELDRYIREHASQDVKRDVARVFVAVQAGAPTLCGYYSLSAASFQRDSLPANQAKRLPRYPVPAVVLGRLAVDERSEEHTSELQSLMRISSAVFCLNNKIIQLTHPLPS